MDLKKILGNIGVTALGTIAPPFGSMAATILKKTLGLDDKATQSELTEAVKNATPEQLLAIKQAENAFLIQMKELDVDIVALDKADTKDARGFAERVGIKTVNALALSNTILVAVTLGGVGYLVYLDKLKSIDALTASLLTLVVREIFAKQEQIYNFFFGSSSGSKEKTDLMGKK